MAEPQLIKGKWRFRYDDPVTGKRTMKTTDARTLAEARVIQRAFLVKQERIEVGIDIADPNPKGWRVKDLMKWWLDEFASKLGSYESDKQRVEKHLLEGKLAERRLETLLPADIERWLHEKSKELAPKKTTPLSPGTLNHLRGFLSRAFTKARKQGHFLGEHPLGDKKVDRRKEDLPVAVFLTKDEVLRVLAVAREIQPQWCGLYACAFYTGLRKGELFALRPEDVNLAAGLIFCQRSHKSKTTKGKRGRVIDIAPELRPFLEAQLALRAGRVFPNPEGGQWIKDTKLSDRFAEVLKRAGIERKLRFHDTRDTFASQFLMSGGDIVALQELLGHRSIETTRKRYGHLSREHVRKQMMNLSMAASAVAPAPPDEPVYTKEARRLTMRPGTQLCTPRAKRKAVANAG